MRKIFLLLLCGNLMLISALAITIDSVNSRDPGRTNNAGYNIALFPELEGTANSQPDMGQSPDRDNIPGPLTLIMVGLALLGIGCVSLLTRRKRQS